MREIYLRILKPYLQYPVGKRDKFSENEMVYP